MEKRNVEILAPAGSYESMVAAVNAGADAVYIGGSRFGARAYADNLDEEAMIRAIDFVHLHGCRIYMTVNTLVKEKELPDLYPYLKPYYEAGLDAVIVQDLGVFSCIREWFPDLHIHVSTQMTVTGKYSAESLKEMGAVRVVPARELSLAEIRAIYDRTGMEIETFVHGALCYCYSGQCLFSSLIGGRSGNRGRCAQTCRLPFDVSRDGKYINKKNEKYVLSLKDLCTLDILPDILEAGVCSLKIEGRMKSPRYTAGVVNIYRKYVDMYLSGGRENYRVDPADRRILLDLFDRGGQTEGYYRSHNGRDMVVLKEKPAFREANSVLFDYLDKTYVNAVKKISIKGAAYLEPGKPIRLTVSVPVSEFRSETKAGASDLLLWEDGDPAEDAKNAPMDEERVRKQLMKTGDSPFVFEELTVTMRGNVFVPVQSLNTLRRRVLEGLEKEMTGRFHRTAPAMEAKTTRMPEAESDRAPQQELNAAEKPEFSALVSCAEQFEAVLSAMKDWREKEEDRGYGIYLDSAEFDAKDWKTLAERCHAAGISCYLMLPRIFRDEAEQYFRGNMDRLKKAGFDALGVGSMEEPGFLKEYMPGTPLYFDHGMYSFNHMAAGTLKEYGAARITVPVELNAREIREASLSGELIVYGYLPVMISAQCIRKTMEGCTKKTETLRLKDRKGKEFAVRNQCRFCCNTIYNESPLSLLGLSDEVKRLSPASLRLQFTLEDRKTTEAVLHAFHEEFLEGRDAAPIKDFTRGHFKRGVE